MPPRSRPGASAQLIHAIAGERPILPREGIDQFRSNAYGCWIADVPKLKHCTTHGDSPEEALREVQVALQAWLETARERGDPIPEPRYRPAPPAARFA